MSSDKESIKYLQEYLGVCLPMNKMLFILGNNSSGKSNFIKIFTNLFSRESHSFYNFNQINNEKARRHLEKLLFNVSHHEETSISRTYLAIKRHMGNKGCKFIGVCNYLPPFYKKHSDGVVFDSVFPWLTFDDNKNEAFLKWLVIDT